MKLLNRRPKHKVVLQDDFSIWASLAFSLALSFQIFSASDGPLFIQGTRVLRACLGCGLSESYTPKMLLVSMGFIIIPASIVLFIVYKIKKDETFKKTSSQTSLQSSQKN